jgi:hypothetical protein
MKKKALDTETSIHDIELPKKQGNVADGVDVCISFMDSEKYAYLTECKELTKGGHFPEIAVFVIE